MNSSNAKDYLPLVQALSEGRVIQFKVAGGWADDSNPVFSGNPSNYRIKPEPREKFFVRNQVSGHEYGPFDNEHHARIYNTDGRLVVRYREVLE